MERELECVRMYIYQRIYDFVLDTLGSQVGTSIVCFGGTFSIANCPEFFS